MRITCLIPARGGSVRIPRKNMQRVGGQTLVERAVRCAMSVARIDTVYVCSEDEEIVGEAIRAGAWHCQRSDELAQSDVSMERIVRHFIASRSLGKDDLVVLLEPTAPLRKPGDIEAALDLVRAANAPAVRTVHASEECHGFMYGDAGLASVVRVGGFHDCLFPEGTLLLHRGDDRGVDVDEMADLVLARALA